MPPLSPEQVERFNKSMRAIEPVLPQQGPYRETLTRFGQGAISNADMRCLTRLASGFEGCRKAMADLLLLASEISGINAQGWAEMQLRQALESNPRVFVERSLSTALQDRFSSVTYISCGGMGMVVKAWDTKGNRFVALKFNLAIDDKKRKHCFLDEGRHAASIGAHPNVVIVYENAEVKVPYHHQEVTLPFLISEWVEGAQDGKALVEFLEKAKNFPTEARIFFALTAAKGLQAAHEKGLIHQDVKSNNFLVPQKVWGAIEAWKVSKNDRALITALEETDGLKLTDFGLAEAVHSETSPEGDLKGTPYNMAPEVLKGGIAPEPSRDVYALGIFLYQLLIGYQDPLSISKGVSPERGSGAQEMAHVCIKIAGTQDRSPAIAGPEKDPHVKYFLEQGSPEEKVLNQKAFAALQPMTAYERTERPQLEDVIAPLEEQLNLRAKTAEVKALERNKRIAIMSTGVLAIAIIALIFSIPPLMKKDRKGKFSQGTARTVEQCDGLICENKWSEASELLKGLISAIEGNEDFDENEKGERKRLAESRRTFVQGMLLIADDYLKRDPPDFEEARKVLHSIHGVAPTGIPIVEHMDRHINVSEVHVLLPQSMLAFWTGDFKKARGIFSRIAALGDAGLSEETSAELTECRQRLGGVEEKLANMEKDVLESLGLMKNPNGSLKRKRTLDDEAWKNLMESLLDDDDESVSINRILMIADLLARSSDELGDAIDRSRLKALFNLLFEHSHAFEEHIRITPGVLLKLQKHLLKFMEDQKKEITELSPKLISETGTEKNPLSKALTASVLRYLEAIAVSIRIERTLSGGNSEKIARMIAEARSFYEEAKQALPKRAARSLLDEMHHSPLANALLPFIEKRH